MHRSVQGVKGEGLALHPLWREACTLDGRSFYINPFNGRLSKRPYPAPEVPRGGILCDEMGLGKTVELLACIAANPFQGTFDVRTQIMPPVPPPWLQEL